MADLRIVDAPVLLQESITDDVKMPTGGLGNYAIRLGDLIWYVVTKENLASKSYVDNSSKGVQDKLDAHTDDEDNPHKVTKTQVGLGNVDNTADIDKPVSDATKSAIITATNDMATKTYVNQQDNLKADKATTLSGYGIKDAYTKNEINTSISLKADTSYVDGKSGDLTTLTTTDKSSLVKAVNEVYDKTALFYNTVADMVADTKLKAGKAVITHGYYTPNDGGGARYLIKDTATDYSIPVANNLHALLSDSFDIRKFGIRNNATLNQTTEIKRMVGYADTRVYEIDFLNYSLMTPKITHFFTSRTTLVGMGFRKVHHLKNLIIANNKTEQLVAGTNPILFLPDNLNGRGTFKLSNVKFDPYVSNFLLNNNGEADGYLCGLVVQWHKDAALTYPEELLVSKYDIELEDVEFLSPAISYNLACGGIFTRNLKANNVRGDYWGLMLVHHTYNLDADNVHGVFRDDLHTGSGRRLVTTLIHEEAEIRDAGVITRNNISVKNSSGYKKTDGSKYSVYKCHRIGTITINNFIGDNNIGSHDFYSGDTEETKRRLVIKNLTIQNGNELRFSSACQIDNAQFKNFDISPHYLLNGCYFKNVVVDNIKVLGRAIAITNFTADNLTVSNINEVQDTTYGIVRTAAAYVKNINLKNITCEQNKLIECIFDNISIDNLKVNFGVLSNLIFNFSTTPATITLKNSSINATSGLWYYHDANYSATDTINIVNTDIINASLSVATSATKTYSNCRIKRNTTYDPPSLATATQQTKVITFAGANVGDNVNVSFSQPMQGTRMWAEVTAVDTVTVYHRNDTGVAVDLPNGTLTVKIV